MKQYVIVDLNEKLIVRSDGYLTFINKPDRKGVRCYGSEGMVRNALRSKKYVWGYVQDYMKETYGEDWYDESYGENFLKAKDVEICL